MSASSEEQGRGKDDRGSSTAAPFSAAAGSSSRASDATSQPLPPSYEAVEAGEAVADDDEVEEVTCLLCCLWLLEQLVLLLEQLVLLLQQLVLLLQQLVWLLEQLVLLLQQLVLLEGSCILTQKMNSFILHLLCFTILGMVHVS